MDPSSKKRKSDENGAAPSAATLTPEDARKIIQSFTQEQLLGIVGDAMCRGDAGVLDSVRAIADRDPAQRKLFIRGLCLDTTTEGLRSLFSSYGDLEEAVVIADKATGRSKGYGFITFHHIDGALLALKEPSKKIDGRMTVTQLASVGNAPAPHAVDASNRKIYVSGVHADLPADRLLAHFSSYGEVEEGPLGFDKLTGKSRGFALFLYKTAEAARVALEEPTKIIDGHQVVCKIAIDGKKGNLVAPGAVAPASGVQSQQTVTGADTHREGHGLGPHSSLTSSHAYGVPGSGGLSSFGGYPAGALPGAAGMSHHYQLNSPWQSSTGTVNPGLSSIGSQVTQVPTAMGGGSRADGYGGLGGSYGYSSQYTGPGSGAYRGLDTGSSLYRMPPSSVGVPPGGYPERGRYELSSYQSQHHQPAGASPGPGVPMGGGMNQSIPPYY